MKRFGTVMFLGLCLIVIAVQRVHMTHDAQTIQMLEQEVEKRRELVDQAKRIEFDLIEQHAEQWCEDTVRELVDDLDDCEWGRMQHDCDSCWSLVGYRNEYGEDQMEAFCAYRYLSFDERMFIEAKRNICQ